MDAPGTVAAFAFVHAATNLDNFACLVAIGAARGSGRAVVVFAAVQVIVLGLAWGLSLAVERLDVAWIGFIGIVPILLGLAALRGGNSSDGPVAAAGIVALVTLFTPMSLDTFAVFLALWSDTATRLDAAILAGAALSLGAICGLAALAPRLGRTLGPHAARLEAATPWVMIASGLYVIANTATDVAP